LFARTIPDALEWRPLASPLSPSLAVERWQHAAANLAVPTGLKFLQLKHARQRTSPQIRRFSLAAVCMSQSKREWSERLPGSMAGAHRLL
jgi:hypothetical protein